MRGTKPYSAVKLIIELLSGWWTVGDSYQTIRNEL